MDLQQLLDLGILEPWQVAAMKERQQWAIEDLQDQVMQQSADQSFNAWMGQHDATYGSNMTGLANKLRAASAAASDAVYRKYMG